MKTAQWIAGSRSKTTLIGHLIERNRKSAQDLQTLLDAEGVGWTVHPGEAEAHIPTIMESLDQSTPLFAFIDPFGLPIPFTMLTDILKRGGRRTDYGRAGGAATEVLLNFSIPGINRAGGQLTGTGTHPKWLQARDTIVGRMDAVLDGTWWHDIWESGADDRVEQILSGYKERVFKAVKGWGIFDVAVSDRWRGASDYHLLLLTQHPDGVWNFHESVSSAMEEYRQYCHQHEGMFDLEPLPQRESEWIDEIARNVDGILSAEGQFRPVDKIAEVYGEAFGQARQKHLRKVLERLRNEGKTSTNCKGQSDLGGLLIRPA